MIKNFERLCCSVAFVLLFIHANAQKKDNKDYASHPYWIEMMNDTNANYFETVKAFNFYWKAREKPQSEDEKFSKGEQDEKVKSKNIPYSFEYKKFQRWQMQVKPYVQDDGSILYPYQRVRLRQNARSANPVNNIK